VRQATNIQEAYLSTRLNLARLGLPPDGDEATAFRRWLAHRAYRSARKLAAGGDLAGAKNQLRWALRLNANARTVGLAARVWLRALGGGMARSGRAAHSM
jgi:hypothetical protein